MNKPVPPCKGCPERTTYCHSYCSKYKQYTHKKEEWTDKVNQSRELQQLYYGFLRRHNK